MATKKAVFLAYRKTRSPDLAAQIIRENHGLIKLMVGRFKAAWQVPIPDEDLHASAHWGILRALEKFDPDKGKFSTWAGEWIRRGLQDCARAHGYKARERVPASLLQEIRLFREREGREPLKSELTVPLVYGKPDPTAIDRALMPLPWFDSMDEVRGDLSKEEDADGSFHGMLASGHTRPEVKIALTRAAARLNAQTRDAFMAFANGQTPHQIAKAVGLSPDKVQDMIDVARRTFQEEMPEGPLCLT